MSINGTDINMDKRLTNILIEEAAMVILNKYGYDYWREIYDFNALNDYKIEEILE